jgi:hypothetical protein
MKYHIKIVMLALVIFTITIAGCKRQTCYNCYLYYGVFKYYKNAGDTYSTPTIPNRHWLLDSENLHINQGYTIIDVYGSYFALGTMCDTNNIGGPFVVNPDSCVFSHYKF